MPVKLSLDVIDIARPCPADWDAMRGNTRVRHCDHCQLNVYNLSEMTRPQAERLLLETEGRLCVRLYRRRDGTVITRDCEGAIKLAAKKMSRLAGVACAAVITGIFAPFGIRDQVAVASGVGEPSVTVRLMQRVIQRLQPRMSVGQVALTGKIALPPTTIPSTAPAEVLQGDVAPPAKMGEIGPTMGKPREPTTQPTTR